MQRLMIIPAVAPLGLDPYMVSVSRGFTPGYVPSPRWGFPA